MVQSGSGGWPRWRLATGGSGLVPRAEKRSGLEQIRWGRGTGEGMATTWRGEAEEPGGRRRWPGTGPSRRDPAGTGKGGGDGWRRRPAKGERNHERAERRRGSDEERGGQGRRPGSGQHGRRGAVQVAECAGGNELQKGRRGCCRAGGAEAGASRAARGRAIVVLSHSGSSDEEGCGRWGAV